MPSIIHEVAAIVRREDFYDDANAKIFGAMTALRSVGKPIDVTLLRSYLIRVGDWDSVNPAYFAKVLSSVPNAANGTWYADIVAEKALARRLIEQCTELLSSAYSGDRPEDVLRQMQSACHALADSSTNATAHPISLSEAAREVVARLSDPEKLSRVNRAAWGLPSLDERLGPIMPGEVAVVAARPGMGKTAWGCQMLRHSAELGRPSLLVSLEMGSEEIAGRDLARLTDIDSRKIRRGEIGNEDRQAISNAQESIGDLPFYIYAPPVATLADIRGTLLRAIDRQGVRLAAIDYLSLIDIEKADRRNQRHEQVAAISRGLKRLSKELKIPLVVLQQLNREADGNEPRLRDLRESGAVEQDADVVMFIHHGIYNKKQMPANERMMLIPKFRAGPVGNITVGWEGARTEFTERPITNNPSYVAAFDEWNERADIQ